MNRSVALLALTLALAGCKVGPNYVKPEAAAPARFKELDGWKPSAPADAADKGPWWQVYHDPELDRLEAMVDISNQTVKQYEAQYRNAVALVAEARASLFPTVAVSPSITQSGGGASRGGGRTTSSGGTSLSASGSVSWDLDIWGRVRRQIESNEDAVTVSAADLANARLSAQATLASDYFDLRASDALADLLTDTAANYRRALDIARNQYNAGTSSNADVVTAEAQLQSTEATLAGVGVQRQQYEHAIAMLTGHAPSDLTITKTSLAVDVPVAPVGLPSALLERRPDIAAAERQVAANNALIGVATAAFYPDLTLSASGGLAGTTLANLFNISNSVWSLGASASETLFSGGARTAAVDAARATYDASVASYRQTVLTGFQQVEDQLSNLRILEQQAKAQAVAVESARRAVEITLNTYRAGTVAYTSVITEQTLLLSDQQAALSIQQNRLLASVALIEALGGGWQAP
jgi:NodT family efflux transporter outer membrane factor (OMF) lipoprotein